MNAVKLFLLCALSFFTMTAGALAQGSIQVSIPDTQGDSAVSIPIVVGDVTGRGVISYQATITFDPLVLQYTGCSNKGTISEPWGPPFCAEPTPGEVNVGGFGTAALSGSGDLVKLEFYVVGSPCDSTLLHFQSFLFNAGDPVADPLVDGMFVIPSVTLTSPNGGEKWQGGSNHDITWECTPVGEGTVTLKYSTDGGGSYPNTIASGEGNDGSYNWTLPEIDSDQVRVKVEVHGSLLAEDESDGDFMIDSTSPYTTGHNPAKDTTGVSPSTNIYVEVKDDLAGVDQSSIVMTVEGSVVTPTITPITGGYAVDYDPPTDFAYGQLVDVTVDANDQAEPVPGNVMPTDSYSCTVRTDGGDIQVQIPDTQGESATSVSIPIVVGDVTGREVISYQATITFDPLVLDFIRCSETGTISELWGPPFCAEPTPGEVNVGGSGTSALSGSGDLVMLEFDVVGSDGDSTVLHFQSFLFNEGDPVADPLLDGTFDVVGDKRDSLIVLDSYGAPASTDNSMLIGLINSMDVAGAELHLTYDLRLLTPVDVLRTPRTADFNMLAWSVATPGTLIILLFDTDGDVIIPGTGPILDIRFDVDNSAVYSESTLVHLDEAILSDIEGNPISCALVDGWFHFGMKGDVNGDGKINILDIIRMVNIILYGIDTLPEPPPHEYQWWAADCNCDDKVNILDIILVVKCILYGGEYCDFCSGELAKISTQPARIGVDQVSHPTPNKVTVPISIETPVPLAGLQLTLDYDSDRLAPGEVQVTELTDGFTVASRVQSGELTLLLYSTTGQLIPAGSGPIVQIPFKLSSKKAGGGKLHFEEAILAGENGGSIPVITKDAELPAAVPKSYGLSQNYPNPFNPETNIDYQLPEEGWVTLKVYNIEGQLVRTLVDGEREVGRYEVKWNVCDSFGKPVSSGIYFYRLHAGEFTQTRRMILIK